MKKLFALAMALVLAFSMVGCNNDAQNSVGPGRPISTYIGNDVTKIKVTHYVSGEENSWIAEGEEINGLKEWANNLKYDIVEFEESQTPGESEGGEVYDFTLTEGNYPGFSYIINGDNCYLLIEEYWYAVSNPSNPPITDRKDSAPEKVASPTPKLMVVVGGTEINTLLGNYEWIEKLTDGEKKTVIDGEYPLLCKDFMPSVVLSPSEDTLTATLNFEIAPNQVSVRCWSEESWGQINAASEPVKVSTIEPEQLQGNNGILNPTYIVELKNGNFIYEVVATWAAIENYSGTVNYSFYTITDK